MKIALALIVKGTDEEAAMLDRCLESTAEHVDGIFITQTQPNKAVEKVCKKYKAIRSDFSWCNNFAAARNFNFSQVPKEYDWILWTDADDLWRGLDKLKPTLEAHPNYDAFALWYLYDWDEFKKPTVVHKKTMLVKNDGTFSWKGALHEDLDANRAAEVYFMEGIERCHISSKERHAANAKRNVEVAASDMKANPKDPRSFWNLGNSLFGVGDWKGARSALETFLTISESDDEKYVVYQRLADCEKQLQNSSGAIKQLQHAIGLFPRLPDAYFQIGYVYFSYGNMEKAEQYLIQGLMLKPQTHKMIVYNPRDYDYNPMMLLAKVYYRLNRPDLMLPLLEGCLKIYPNDEHLKTLVKEGKHEKALLGEALVVFDKLKEIKDDVKLKKELDGLASHLKSHPGIAAFRNERFIKTESSGKDMVYYCGMTTHEWYDGASGFIGGSEEAVINLTRAFAELGWRVTVYNNCGHMGRTVHGVSYRPYWEFNFRDKQDAMILWRHTKPLDAPLNCPKIFLDIHDAISDGEFTPKRLEKVTKVFVKSKFHRSLLPSVPDDKIAVIPNGVDLSLFEKVKKDPYLIINTSSPDRSMDVLPKLFEQVKKEVPKARLVWAYGWEVYKNSYGADTKKIEWMGKTIEEMERVGIEVVGRLSQEKVADLYSKATILAYPTEFAEIDCISVRKAQIAGCYPIATDFGALSESIRYGVTIHSKKTKDDWCKPYQFTFGLEDEKAQQEWVRATVKALKRRKPLMPHVEQWAKQFRWSNIARLWNEVIA